MVQLRAIVTTAEQYKVVYDLSIIAVFSDLNNDRRKMMLTQISRSRQYSTLSISIMVEDRDIVTMEDEYELICDVSNGAICNNF